MRRNLTVAAAALALSSDAYARGQGDAGLLSFGLLAALAGFGVLYWLRKTYPQLGPALVGLVVAGGASALGAEALEGLGVIPRERAALAMLAILAAIYVLPVAVLWIRARRQPAAPTAGTER